MSSNFSDSASDAERTRSLASKLRDKASEVGSTVSETLSRQRENAAGGLDRVASTIHENGEKAARAAHSIADGMESTASYIRDHDFKDVGDSVLDLFRKYPAQSFISAVAIGFLLSRAIRR